MGYIFLLLFQVSPIHLSHVALSFVCVACSATSDESQKGNYIIWIFCTLIYKIP